MSVASIIGNGDIPFEDWVGIEERTAEFVAGKD